MGATGAGKGLEVKRCVEELSGWRVRVAEEESRWIEGELKFVAIDTNTPFLSKRWARL